MSRNGSQPKWYAAGLHFGCTGCGACCSGPGEGVIWITVPEIQRLAAFLRLDEQTLRARYLRREGRRVTIIEDPTTRDCIFLETHATGKRCRIYPVRPNQCRTWPFWSDNLRSPDTWNEAARGCPGIHRGEHVDLETIERIRHQRRWWEDDDV